MKHLLIFLVFLGCLTGCTSTVSSDPSILRVGITPNNPPLIFKEGTEISGVEASFARKLGKDLEREVVFVEVPWSRQIDYIKENKTDIIMSGMTVTMARDYLINFTKPYMVAGLTALFRRSDYARNGLGPSIIRHQNTKVGALKNTTGEIYAVNNYSNAEIIIYDNTKEAVKALKSGRINMFIHDAPSIWWVAAENEVDLVAFYELMNNEAMAWGISKNNTELLDQVNESLEKMKMDGSGEKILKNWFPGRHP